MRAAVGKEWGGRTSFPIALSDIRKWAIAVYYPEPPPPLYWDEKYAASTSHGGIVAPEEFNPFAWMTAEGPKKTAEGPVTSSAAGPEGILGLAPVPTLYMLNGGLESTYTRVRMRPGDVITSVNALVDYRERPGRLGQMLFTVTEQRW